MPGQEGVYIVVVNNRSGKQAVCACSSFTFKKHTTTSLLFCLLYSNIVERITAMERGLGAKHKDVIKHSVRTYPETSGANGHIHHGLSIDVSGADGLDGCDDGRHRLGVWRRQPCPLSGAWRG